MKLYLEKGGDLESFWRMAGALEDPDIKMPWTEDKEGFERKYAVLSRAHWDLERIRRHHE